MTEQCIIIKRIQGWEWETKRVICIADSYKLAEAIIAYLKTHDEPEKDEDGSDAYVEYFITTKFVMTDLDDFITHWEG